MYQDSTQPLTDIAIVGGGPAALSAALYVARAGLSVTIYERSTPGGLLAIIPEIQNYPGFVGTGSDLTKHMLDQIAALDVPVEYGECTDITHYHDHFALTIDDDIINSRAVIIATGSLPRSLNFTPTPPVSYCALCDGHLAQGKQVAVIGGANSAVQEAIYLAGLAASVTLITHSQLKADQALQDILRSLANVKIVENTEPTSHLLKQFDHIFVYIGQTPASTCLHSLAGQLLEGDKLLDGQGYVLTKQNLLPNAQDNHTQDHTSNILTHETIVPGLFAAGDVRAGSIHQVVTAAADGAAAAIEAISYLKHRSA